MNNEFDFSRESDPTRHWTRERRHAEIMRLGTELSDNYAQMSDRERQIAFKRIYNLFHDQYRTIWNMLHPLYNHGRLAFSIPMYDGYGVWGNPLPTTPTQPPQLPLPVPDDPVPPGALPFRPVGEDTDIDELLESMIQLIEGNQNNE